MADKPKLAKPTPLQRPAAPQTSAELGKAFKARWPTVWRYMSDRAWEDGTDRQLATLLFVVDPDGLKGCLNDRSTGASLWVTGTDFNNVLDEMEAAVTSDAPRWRANRRAM